MLLSEKRSISTRKAYDRDVKHFFTTIFGVEYTAEWVVRFLALPQAQALEWVVRYKATMIGRGLSEATVNRRLSALRALVHKGRVLGVCSYTLEDIKGETVIKYRDTSSVTPQEFKQILLTCDRTTAKGVRDYAILCLLWDNVNSELTGDSIDLVDAAPNTCESNRATFRVECLGTLVGKLKLDDIHPPTSTQTTKST